jgi:F-type H+-transporting ATPase subunit gamma
MAKARAIVKRRKAVRNIRKITKTMQMIATAKFQKSLKRAVGAKLYSLKVRELVKELAANVGEIDHPLLRRPTDADRKRKIALVVLTSNRGLAGAYNGTVLRAANHFIREQVAAGNAIDLYVAGKKGIAYFNFQKRPITQRIEMADPVRFSEAAALAEQLIAQFTSGQVDAVYVASMNFRSASNQRPEVMNLLPLAGVETPGPAATQPAELKTQVVYEFSPDPMSLLDELLPLTVRTALFQAFLDATTSEHVARMISMKSATDNADKMVKSLTMQYNRARQSQITTELSEIMGGVEAMEA